MNSILSSAAASLLTIAALLKAVHAERFVKTVVAVIGVAFPAFLMILCEVLLAVLLVAGGPRTAVLALGCAVGASFAFAGIKGVRSQSVIQCACFGGTQSRLGWRNVVWGGLMIMSLYLLYEPGGAWRVRAGLLAGYLDLFFLGQLLAIVWKFRVDRRAMDPLIAGYRAQLVPESAR